MQKRLFEIYDFILKDDNIIVQIQDNNYTDNSIVIPVFKFEAYLDRHERLYFESNDYSTGQLVSKKYILSFDNYWDEIEREYKEQDIYDFICATMVDFQKSMNIQLAQIQSILNHFIW
jgi:hypothetical protein